MDDKLPSSVDVIVLGTGLGESIVAAACARSGLDVLHLDRNDFYGADWSSFNLKTADEWIQQQNSPPKEPCDPASSYSNLLQEGESFVSLANRRTVKDVKQEWTPFCKETTPRTVKDVTEETTHKSVLDKEWRKFSIDMAPKVLLSRGAMVQTLCDSEVSKYAEFKCVDRFLCMEEGENGLIYNTVPCSKGDIFQNETLSMIDKRRLMKFLTFCLQWHTKSEEMEEWKPFASDPFEKFLQSMGITDRLQQFVTTSIGILHPNANTKEGLSAVCRFVDSVGRFGPSPFLAALYGCGELPQCFCRLCAVFGGLYCLGRPVEALIEKGGVAIGVIADGQRIECKHVIMSAEYLPEQYVSKSVEVREQWLDRAVYITEKSIKEGEKEHVSLVNLAPLDQKSATRLLEVGYEVCAAPKGYYLLHLTGRTEEGSDVTKIADKVFEGPNAPHPLWSLHFRTLSHQPVGELPANLTVVQGPDHSLDYAAVVQKAREIFTTFWPDRDFLPRSLKKEEEEDTVEGEGTTVAEERSTVTGEGTTVTEEIVSEEKNGSDNQETTEHTAETA